MQCIQFVCYMYHYDCYFLNVTYIKCYESVFSFVCVFCEAWVRNANVFQNNSNNIRFPETIAEAFCIHLVMVYMLGCYLYV